MTKVITRYFESADKARATEQALLDQGVPRTALRVHKDQNGLAQTLTGARVDASTAEAYQDRLAKGGAVLQVNARYTPLGVARITRETMAHMGAADMGGITEEVFVKDKPGEMTSILQDHPLMLTREKDPSRTTYHMADWPIPLISRRKPNSDMLIPRHGRMANWPFPLLSHHKPRDDFAFPRHARMANIILPLIFRRKPSDRFAFPRHARMANFPLPLISRRKPYTGTLIGRHTRMANLPFPHLINGDKVENAIIPGGPRMANVPVPLLSDREPYDKFAFPRHSRMAKLLLPLISRRKPFTGSIFPRHARMANFPLPLLTKRRAGFSLSKLLGLPTVIRR